MDTRSLKADFLSAKAKMAVTIMNATGWQQGTVNPQHLSVDSVFFYVFDYQTKWTWCCSVPLEPFYMAVAHAASVEHAHSIASCERIVADCASARDVPPEKENELAIALIFYIRLTRAYELSDRATKANHFVVIRYGSTETLRPFAMGGPARYLVAEARIGEAIQKVVAMDTASHPEWMKKS